MAEQLDPAEHPDLVNFNAIVNEAMGLLEDALARGYRVMKVSRRRWFRPSRGFDPYG